MSMLFIDEEDFKNHMKEAQVLYLSTSQNDYVSSRPVSPVNIGMTVYFYTDDFSLKALQMHANPRVAACVGPYQLEGKVRFLGHPLDPAISEVADVYKAKYGETFEDIGDTVVFVAIDITRLRQWIFENGEPVNMAEMRY